MPVRFFVDNVIYSLKFDLRQIYFQTHYSNLSYTETNKTPNKITGEPYL